MAEASQDDRILIPQGPKEGVRYPLKVVYCGVCTLPVEYCEHMGTIEKCRQWLEKNLPSEFEKLQVEGSDEAADADGEEKKKRQTRGGRGVVKTKKKQEPQQVCLSRAPRGKKKYVTVVTGLATYEINLKDASKVFASKFSCGSSVTGDDEIVIQGDVKDDLFDFLPEKWSQIDEDSIDDLGDLKR